MKVTSILVLASVITVAGQWAQKKTLTIRIGVGLAFVLISMTGFYNVEPQLATQFAWLILVGTVVFNGIPLFQAVKRVAQ